MRFETRLSVYGNAILTHVATTIARILTKVQDGVVPGETGGLGSCRGAARRSAADSVRRPGSHQGGTDELDGHKF